MNEPVSIWAPGGDEEHRATEAHTDHDTPSATPETTRHADAGSPDRAPDRVRATHDPHRRPADEFEAIFGSPTEIRPLGQEAIAHRRRGMASAAGGGEVLDRRQRGTSDDVLVTLLAHPAMAAERAVTGSASAGRSGRASVRTARRRVRRVAADVPLDAATGTTPPLRLGVDERHRAHAHTQRGPPSTVSLVRAVRQSRDGAGRRATRRRGRTAALATAAQRVSVSPTPRRSDRGRRALQVVDG